MGIGQPQRVRDERRQLGVPPLPIAVRYAAIGGAVNGKVHLPETLATGQDAFPVSGAATGRAVD